MPPPMANWSSPATRLRSRSILDETKGMGGPMAVPVLRRDWQNGVNDLQRAAASRGPTGGLGSRGRWRMPAPMSLRSGASA